MRKADEYRPPHEKKRQDERNASKDIEHGDVGCEPRSNAKRRAGNDKDIPPFHQRVRLGKEFGIRGLMIESVFI